VNFDLEEIVDVNLRLTSSVDLPPVSFRSTRIKNRGLRKREDDS
jgi:hypothetical protein